MSRVTLSVRVVSNLVPSLPARARAGAERARQETEREIVEAARARAPVVTGKLRDSVRVLSPGLVGTELDYAPYVEYGTHFARAQPFLTPAAEWARPRYEARMRAVLA